MYCRLCQRETKLCRSHIIPEFCFKGLYDERHRFIHMYDVRNEKHCLGQKGFREPLLCGSCESLFAKYERHCRRLFTDPLPSLRTGTKRAIDIPRLDPSKLRYFLLSILWRAGESENEMFAHVDLGEKHSEALRSNLLAEELPKFDQYGCFVSVLHHEGRPMKDMIVEPTYCRVDGHKVYRLVFTGLLVHVFVSAHPVPERLRRLFVGATGHVTVYAADLEEFAFLRRMWCRQ